MAAQSRDEPVPYSSPPNTQLLGVKAAIARSFERIHRSNLVGMGVLPLAQSADGLVHGSGPVKVRTVQPMPASTAISNRPSPSSTC